MIHQISRYMVQQPTEKIEVIAHALCITSLRLYIAIYWVIQFIHKIKFSLLLNFKGAITLGKSYHTISTKYNVAIHLTTTRELEDWTLPPT